MSATLSQINLGSEPVAYVNPQEPVIKGKDQALTLMKCGKKSSIFDILVEFLRSMIKWKTLQISEMVKVVIVGIENIPWKCQRVQTSARSGLLKCGPYWNKLLHKMLHKMLHTQHTTGMCACDKCSHTKKFKSPSNSHGTWHTTRSASKKSSITNILCS